MLPSTGYFKGISCPFYDSGLCERPYCHFRHAKRDPPNTERDCIESGEILQKLVSAAVQKVLQQTEKSTSATQPSSDDHASENTKSNVLAASKATYNPTPISELNKINVTDVETVEENEQRKRHIPVPYTPRKPASVPLRKPPETNGSFNPYIYTPPQVKYTPGCAENIQCDSYTPPGSTECKEKYLPGTETRLQEYTPDDNAQNKCNVRNYIPSDKSVSKTKVLEYQPTKVTTKKDIQSVTYQPTPRSLAPCFSSDEDEPDIKKIKLSSDLNGLDDLGPEFDILDQILDDETHGTDSKNKVNKDDMDKNVRCSNKADRVIEDSKTEKSIRNNKKTFIDDSNNTKNESRTEKHISKSYSKEVKDNDITKSNSKKKQKIFTNTKENNEGSDDRNRDENKSQKDKSKTLKSKLHKNERTASVDKEKRKLSKKKSKHKSSSRDRDKEKKSEKNKHKKSDRQLEKDKQSKTSNKDTKNSKHRSSRSKSRNSKSSRSNHSNTHTSCKDSKEKCKSKEKSTNNVSHNQYSEEIADEYYSLSDSDEETVALECKKIFEEYVPTAKVNTVEDAPKIEDVNHDEEYIPGKKRISRSNDKNVKAIRKLPVKPNFRVSAVQAMTERLAKVKEFHNSRNIVLTANNESTHNKLDVHKNNYSTHTSANSKIRIAHVPYASTLMHAKKDISHIQSTSKSDSTSSPALSTTITQTIKKGSQRVAHIPNEKFIDRPGVLEPLSSKITANIRSTYLNMMIDECLKLYITSTDAYARAQHEELATSKKCSTVQIYKNSAVLTINRLRKELLECNGVKKSSCDFSTTEKGADVISGKSSNTGSWSIECKNRKSIDYSKELTGAKFYNNISKWIMTEEQLQENRYPRPHTSGEKGRAVIYGQNKQKPPKGLIRTCCRCKKDYTVDKKGFPALKEECIYHPNNKYRVRGEARYQCCSQDGTSDGCCIAPNHVYEYVDFENLKGFVKTLPPDFVMDDYGIYSLDCEMCYTTHGLDLTRVTVINSAYKVVYETLIKPLHPIIDYNTRFSGITEEQMADVKTTLLDVQATLLTMFNSKTILIGHSLESDFKALKLIHDTVIDTSVLFPHKMGPPYKRALRNLSSEYLKKIIQNSVEGHDSAEDALVCMELIHYKLKEELKIR